MEFAMIKFLFNLLRSCTWELDNHSYSIVTYKGTIFGVGCPKL